MVSCCKYNTFVEKMCDALKKIKTTYVVWASDDDFYDLVEIEKGIDFLGNHEQYATYSGKIHNFNVNSNKKTNDKFTNAYGDIQFTEFQYPNKNFEITDDSIFDRLARFHDQVTMEGIYRTSALRNVHEISNNLEILNLILKL